jgi:hypothetical protein
MHSPDHTPAGKVPLPTWETAHVRRLVCLTEGGGCELGGGWGALKYISTPIAAI